MESENEIKKLSAELIKYTQWLNGHSITAQYEEFVPEAMVKYYLQSPEGKANLAHSTISVYCDCKKPR